MRCFFFPITPAPPHNSCEWAIKERQRERGREKDRERERGGERQREGETDRERERGRERGREELHCLLSVKRLMSEIQKLAIMLCLNALAFHPGPSLLTGLIVSVQ